MESWKATNRNIRALAEEYAGTETTWPEDWRIYLFCALPEQDARYDTREGTLDILREIDFASLEA